MRQIEIERRGEKRERDENVVTEKLKNFKSETFLISAFISNVSRPAMQRCNIQKALGCCT